MIGSGPGALSELTVQGFRLALDLRSKSYINDRLIGSGLGPSTSFSDEVVKKKDPWFGATCIPQSDGDPGGRHDWGLRFRDKPSHAEGDKPYS